MKKTYEEPRLLIDLFPGQDVIVCSWGEDPEDPDDPIFNSNGHDDA